MTWLGYDIKVLGRVTVQIQYLRGRQTCDLCGATGGSAYRPVVIAAHASHDVEGSVACWACLDLATSALALATEAG